MKRAILPLLAASLLVGCAADLPAPWDVPHQPVPEAQHAGGAVEIRVSAADRAVATLEGIVAKVRFELSGTNVAGAAPIEVARDQFTGGKATVRWKDLLPGTVTVKVQLQDSAGAQIGHAQGDAKIESGKTTQLTLTIVPDTGTATFAVDVTGEPLAGVGATFAPIATGSWQAAPPMALPRAAHALVALSGQAIAVGGDFANVVERFDPATWRWTPQQLPADRRIRFAVGSAAVLRNKIVVVGRDTESGGKPEAASPIFIDPFAPPFSGVSSRIDSSRPEEVFVDDLQAQRAAVGAASDGEQLYMIGGSSRRSLSGSLDYAFITLDLVEVLSAATGIWTQRAPLQTPRGSLGAALLAGKVYAAGGFRWKGTQLTDPQFGVGGIDSQSASIEPLGALEVYDPAVDSWTILATMPTPRHGLGFVASGGRLYAIGGVGAGGTAVPTVESFDPVAGTWRSEPSLSTARALTAAVALADGTILVTGGFGTDGIALRSAEAFNPGTAP